jgi:putative ABC transport system permease protein
MRDIFFDLSVRSVRLNFLRSLLASIGIVIGVVAISSMGMLGTNMQLMVKDQLTTGINIITITPDVVRAEPGSSVNSVSGITDIQLREIQDAAGVNDVIAIDRTNTQFSIGSNDGRGSIYGLDPEDIKNIMNVSEGSFLRGESDAIVGATIASRFDVKIGTRIKIGEPNISVTRPVIRVVGILPAAGLSTSNGINSDNAIIVSDTWYTGQFGGGNVYDQINVNLKEVSTLTEVEDAIDKKVNRNKDVVRISDSSSRITSISSTLSSLTMFILAIGSISLLVAATSIFNVMMMSVSERVQEIGILLSIGTEKGEIRRMFLYEALILGIIGAGIGGVMSIIIGYTVVSAMIGNTAYFFMPESMVYIPAGVMIGMTVCIVSGLYPAWRASNMNPIDALRSE